MPSFSNPGPYPTPLLGGPIPKRLVKLKPEYPKSTADYIDGGRDVELHNTTPILRWQIDYTGLSVAESVILDTHNEYAADDAYPFSFTDPKSGITHTNVCYEDFQVDHQKNFARARNVKLIKRPV